MTLTWLRCLGKKDLRKCLGLKKQKKFFRFYLTLSHDNCMGNLGEANRRFFCASQNNIVKSSFPDVEIPKMPFHELIFEHIGGCENKIAVECGATGKKCTYKELRRSSLGIAGALQKKFHLEKGDIQAIVLPNCVEYPAIFLAGSTTGIISSTINPAYTPTEISIQLNIVKPKILFTTTSFFNKCLEATKMIKTKIPIVVVKTRSDEEIPTGAVSYSELENDSSTYNPVDFDVNDDLVIPFSSGTSGLPKGVQLSHQNVNSNLMQFTSGTGLKSNPCEETNQIVVLGMLPMFHIYGMVVVTFDTLKEGGRLISLPRFEPKIFMETILTKKIQILYLVPPLIFFLGNQTFVDPKHLKHIQHVVNGAAPCGKNDLDKLAEKYDSLILSQGYGMTETSPAITMTDLKRYHKLSSSGHPLTKTLIKVTDLNNEKPLPSGHRGEIRVKGPQVMKGYFRDLEQTKKVFDNEGWLKTGDIGYYDEDNDFYIVDRIKELIKVKGFQVAPAELEEFLRKHPKILDAGVIGVEHKESGEAPKAFIVVKEGQNLTEEEVKTYIKDQLSSYKQLTGGVQFVKQIPKSDSGKILRQKLKLL